MKHAEQVTFGGSALDRAAELRPEADALRARPDAQAIVLWRGKPLMWEPDAAALVRLPASEPALESARAWIFLGREGEVPVFAADLSNWEPDGDLSDFGAFHDPSRQVHPDLPDDTAFAELRNRMTHLTPRDAELAATAKGVLEWHRSHGFCARCGEKSDIAMAGWQRRCPACGAHHFPRTDPVVIMLITHGNDVLMGRSPGWPEGMYSLLAGFVEPGETLEAAVRREVVEESGIPVGQVRYLASQPWPFPASLMFGCAGEALARDITLDPAELDDALWVSRERMMAAFDGTDPKIKPARAGSIAHFLLRNWLADTLD
ncbi:NAD(+) diphosphatase [Pseudaestuariivita atlantica]|uniref:NAD(+) diphosphatase n=1 Tax=Pseudaestuariivita atlantica TaxID=1317121 RepID=A0A0L1JRC8_9RHOB|nr:NAD(+) diphosphatase [Pseudaestuariivita atlantica]KNG94272.1 NUDIX hydrolase [Pseudaestuariivita atlantica]